MKRYIRSAISDYYNFGNMSYEDKLALIQNPNTPIEHLVAMLEDPDDTIYKKTWEALGNNDSTPSDILETIYNLNDENLNWIIATNPNTPVEILRHIAEEEDVVLQNPNCPLDILERCADMRGEGDYYMYNISCNPNCPGELLHNFIEYAEDDTLLNIAEHPNTYIEDLQELAENPDEEIANAAKVNLQNRNL